MNNVGWAMVGLAAGYAALALYGKYRNIKADFHEARAEEARRAADTPEDEAGPSV